MMSEWSEGLFSLLRMSLMTALNCSETDAEYLMLYFFLNLKGFEFSLHFSQTSCFMSMIYVSIL